MKRARIIYNPTSGREIFKKTLPKFCRSSSRQAMKRLAMRQQGKGMPYRPPETPLSGNLT